MKKRNVLLASVLGIALLTVVFFLFFYSPQQGQIRWGDDCSVPGYDFCAESSYDVEYCIYDNCDPPGTDTVTSYAQVYLTNTKNVNSVNYIVSHGGGTIYGAFAYYVLDDEAYYDVGFEGDKLYYASDVDENFNPDCDEFGCHNPQLQEISPGEQVEYADADGYFGSSYPYYLAWDINQLNSDTYSWTTAAYGFTPGGGVVNVRSFECVYNSDCPSGQICGIGNLEYEEAKEYRIDGPFGGENPYELWQCNIPSCELGEISCNGTVASICKYTRFDGLKMVEIGSQKGFCGLECGRYENQTVSPDLWRTSNYPSALLMEESTCVIDEWYPSEYSYDYIMDLRNEEEQNNNGDDEVPVETEPNNKTLYIVIGSIIGIILIYILLLTLVFKNKRRNRR